MYPVGNAIVDEEVDILSAIVKVGCKSEIGRLASDQFHRAVESLPLVFLEDDVEDTGTALGFITRRRIGDDLDPLHHACLKIIKPAASLHTDKSGWFSVNEDPYIITAAQFYIALGIDRNGRYIHQDIRSRTSGVGKVQSHIEDFFVQ